MLKTSDIPRSRILPYWDKEKPSDELNVYTDGSKLEVKLEASYTIRNKGDQIYQSKRRLEDIYVSRGDLGHQDVPDKAA